MTVRIPTVVIVGRPNVGKSSIFNAILGRRVAIVDQRAGVTRDRVSAEVRHEGRVFELVDTGGIGIVDSDELEEDVEMQISIAIEQADLVLFVVDARLGLTPYDESIAQRLRGAGKKTVLIANKCDSRRQELESTEFFKLGFGKPIQAAANERRGCSEMLERIDRELPDQPGEAEVPEPVMKVAFVGRRNVGKSTLVNALAGQERVIVSEVPGTTRDAVDVAFDYKGTRFLAIDTAGMRKHKQIRDDIEFYSLTRSIEAVQRADVVVHILDAPSEISEVDKKLGATIGEEFKPCVLAVNKMDLVPQVGHKEFADYIRAALPWLNCAPIVTMSALKRDNIDHVVETAAALFEQAGVRVSTAQINEVLGAAVAKRHPPKQGARFAKIYYATQVEVRPPTFALFVNMPRAFDESYLRYLTHEFQSRLPYSSVPLKFYVKGRRRGKSGARR